MLTTPFQEVSHEEFRAFIADYPRKLDAQVTGICEPPLAAWYDFEASDGIRAMVAKYHIVPDVTDRRYSVSRHLLDGEG